MLVWLRRTCKPERRKHKHKRKHKALMLASHRFTRRFLCLFLCLCLCLRRTCKSGLKKLGCCVGGEEKRMYGLLAELIAKGKLDIAKSVYLL